MARASALRTASGSSLWVSMRLPSSQSRVSSRPVESSGHGRGTRTISTPSSISAIERDVLGLAAVIELFAHARANLLGDLAGIDRGVEPPADGEQPLQLLQIGFDRRLHVRILQLAGQQRAVERARTMHLPERSRRRGLMLEARELLFPAGAQLRHHAALDERPTHGRGFALQLLQLGGIFGRQQIRNGRHQLRDLHERTLQAAKRRRQRQRLAGAIGRAAEKPPAGIARRHATHIGADARVARGAGREAVFFRVLIALVLRLSLAWTRRSWPLSLKGRIMAHS